MFYINPIWLIFDISTLPGERQNVDFINSHIYIDLNCFAALHRGLNSRPVLASSGLNY